LAKKRSQKKSPKNKRHPNHLRIIGGNWRSRKLSFIDAPGLRPTPDRIRETLFNWLQAQVHGSRCLDLFAGSGALGLEALSRGASEVLFVEKNRAVAIQLEANLKKLESDANVIQQDAISFLQNETSAFDIIFLDPPYRQNLLKQSLDLIQQQKLLHNDSFIYLEHEAEGHFDWEEQGFEVFRNARSGQVNGLLLRPL